MEFRVNAINATINPTAVHCRLLSSFNYIVELDGALFSHHLTRIHTSLISFSFLAFFFAASQFYTNLLSHLLLR